MSEAQLYTKQYSTNLELALQQTSTKLVDRFDTAMYTGEKVSPVQYLDPIEVSEITGRNEPMPETATNYERRWVAPRSFDLPLYINEEDLLKTIVDPKSAQIEAQRSAFMRNRDNFGYAAFFGDALIGKDGTTTVTWATEAASTPAGSQIVLQTVGSSGGGTAVGLNVAKLVEMRAILETNDVDLDVEEVFIGVNAKANKDLLKEAQIISRDFNDSLVLKSGRVERFMGFTFVPFQRIATDGTYLRLPVWTKKGMHFARWSELKTNVEKDISRRGHPWQLYAKETQNSTRVDAKRVGEIKITAA